MIKHIDQPMLTPFGEALEGVPLAERKPLPEYPRPQMKRESYINLNGLWDYAITQEDAPPEKYDGNILVPFSPECRLSGVMRMVTPKDTLFYHRTFTLPDDFNIGRVLIHFGAVDQIAEVFINEEYVGAHTGGYTPFTFDITKHVKLGENSIDVRVKDTTDSSFHSRGKQKTKRGGIWYTPQSGIWQTVWLESVPATYIERLIIRPLFDESAVELNVMLDTPAPLGVTARVGGVVATGVAGEPIRISMEGFIPWSPEDPKLYGLTVKCGEDTVESYFGMRKFSVGRDESGAKRLMLNNKPYFHNGVLDQGYWSDALYTAPSDEAIVSDILLMKSMGFNTLRKHIKIEPMRFYYHCDRLGMLVWQDMPNGGGEYSPLTVTLPVMSGRSMPDGEANYARFARADAEGRAQYYKELREMVTALINVTSLAMWTPFNEGWGQFDAKKAVDEILSLDTTRTIDHASGWHDQGIGDFSSLHVYFKPYRFKADALGRAVILTEFGGYNLRTEGHAFNRKDFGYKRFGSREELFQAFKRLYTEEIAPAKAKGLSAAIYTQLSDVEDELNGLVTYDRREVKLPSEAVRSIMEELGLIN